MSMIKLNTTSIDNLAFVTEVSKLVSKHLNSIDTEVLSNIRDRCKENYPEASFLNKIEYMIFGTNSTLYRTELYKAYAEIREVNYKNYLDYQSILMKLQEFISDSVLVENNDFILSDYENELITKLMDNTL